ncbi:MAG TPA: glycosyltransferase [Candidatus Levybacteria bacterium]|nr:glycosyltransferase [Candidatus Levybacteria bacterium]
MKIGFFTDGYLPQKNGVATSVAEYAQGLQKKGHSVTIIAPKYPRFKDKKNNVIRLSSINYKKSIGVRLAVYLPEKAFRELLKLDFDVIHGHGDGPVTMLGWIIAKQKNIPFILSHHTFWNKYTHYLPAGILIRPRMVEKFTQLFANSCNAIISPSNMSKKELESYGVSKPITVIHHGLDLSNYQKGDTQFLRKKLKIANNHKILLYVGRLGKEKSVDLLLHAFKKVQQQSPHVSLVVIGDGPQKQDLQHLAKTLGIAQNTYFIGEIEYSKIPSVFHSADIFVFASKTETLGKVILEAMAAGLPTVTLNIAPFKELLTNNKEGILVSSNPTAFAKGITTLVQDDVLRKSMGENARRKADQFSIEHAVKKIEDIYVKLYELRKKRRITYIISRVRDFIDVEFR